jgi:cytochrome-b5 reductase
MLRGLCIFGGSVLGGAVGYRFTSADPSAAAAVHCKSANACIFSPEEFRAFRLIGTQFESHDTRRFFFAIEGDVAANSGGVMNLPVASCIVCKFTDTSGQDITRPYTPISTNTTKGRFELLVKRYPRSRMGSHLFQLRNGETLLLKGPFEKFKYSPNMWTHVGMIAGGTGITPMYQVIRAILDNPKDKTQINLIYANNERRDILLANELTELQKAFPNFQCHLTLLKVPKRWLGGIGYVNRCMVESFMPRPGAKGTKVLVCGPPPMMQAISGEKEYPKGKAPEQGPLAGILKDMGYTSE